MPYLNFQGNTEEVLNTYQKIFNGNVEQLIRFGDQFQGDDAYKNNILHARLSFGNTTLLFSDCMPKDQIIHGNGIHLCIELKGENEANRVFAELSEGGQVNMPLSKQFWGALYGQLTDRFGINWMINCG
ncbi:MAG TPA: VOC family protein [Mucilaginibacter sp.]|nr:VOC family protein [Mucilaginibacter sp.]